jgi:dethiobiotin synthetase
MNYFVTAIHTDSGKTLVSAILCQALRADYWKPVQAGIPTDSDTLRTLVPGVTIHPEGYRLKMPASPHAAARAEGIAITRAGFTLPRTSGHLVIEGAGGCLVPLNETDFVIDLATWFNARVILVSNLYLGSINHTLLTYEALRARNLTPMGIVFNGTPNAESEQIILRHTALPCLLRVRREEIVTSDTVKHYANQLRQTLHELTGNR